MATTDQLEDTLARAKARVGSVLRGKYRLDCVLGLGGMAAVYKATHRNHAEFAIKMLHAELSIRADVRQRFLREGYAANSVKHPGVVLVVDDDVAEDGAAFLVMELVQGLDVDALCDRSQGRLPVPAVLSIGYQLLDVLAAAHDKGIVHRDIKPANLFITTTGVMKVLDFGIARARDVAVSSGAATGTGMVLGTPAFMSPEQAIGKSSDVDAQSDIWAVGASMFRLLTGQMVHTADSAQHLMILTATTPPRSLRSLMSDAPGVLVELIDKALAFDKSQRWSTAIAMREAIGAASRELLGELPSSGVLVPLVQQARASSDQQSAAAAMAPTENAQDVPNTGPGPGSTQTMPPAPARTPSPDGTLPSGSDARGKHEAGSSTAKPVSSGTPPDGAVRKRRGLVLPALAVATFAALAVVATLRFRSQDVSGASAPGPSAPAPSVVVAQTVAPTMPSVALEPTSDVSTVDAGSAVLSAGARTPGSPALPPRPAARAPSSAQPPTPSAKPKCHMTTWVDDSGETHAKQVCE